MREPLSISRHFREAENAAADYTQIHRYTNSNAVRNAHPARGDRAFHTAPGLLRYVRRACARLTNGQREKCPRAED